MGSGVWFKNIISKKKRKDDKSQKSKKHSEPENINGNKDELFMDKECTVDNRSQLAKNSAATKIQTAYRAYLGRKTFRRMRGISRLQNLVQRDNVKKQASTTLSHLHSWSRMQSQIRTRRVHMVTEGRLKQKKLEDQLKLEAKLHDFEVEWNAGSETHDEALAKIHQREEAAVKRERAMAYAFTHQWRANSNPSFGSGNHELSKSNWGWSWMDRWIAARPWESRGAVNESPKKSNGRQPIKIAKNKISPTCKAPDNKLKLISSNGKAAAGKARKLSFEPSEKIGAQKVNPKVEEKKSKNEIEES